MSAWAYGLLGIGLGIYLLSFLFGHFDADRTHRSTAWARMASSAALVLAALVWWLGVGRATSLAGYTAFLFFGMLCSFVGDLTLARLLPLRPHLPFGMLAFGAAHVLYLCGYAQAGRALALDNPWAWIGGVAGGLLLAVLVWWTFIRAPDARSALDVGALGYALLLGAMAGAAVALAAQEPRLWVLAGGALLFLASDTILGNRLFRRNNWRLVGDAVWALYIAGQALIVFSTAALLE